MLIENKKIEDLYKLKMGESIFLTTEDYYTAGKCILSTTTITRVPGGWIYRDCTEITVEKTEFFLQNCTFVPFKNEDEFLRNSDYVPPPPLDNYAIDRKGI